MRVPICRLESFVLLAALLMAVGCSGGALSDRRRPSEPGDLALDFVASDNYPALLVEVDYVQGFGPSAAALARFQEVLARRLSKPRGVDVLVDEEIPACLGRSTWQIGDILAIEERFRSNRTGDERNRERAVLWIVYLDGSSESDRGRTRTLGLAFDGAGVAIFHENLERATVRLTRDVVETIVLLHEGGHLFGLVNNGLPMAFGHEDALHPRHDANSGCVMHYRIPTGDLELLVTDPPLDYDYPCQLDLFAAGGPEPDDPDGALAAVPPPAADWPGPEGPRGPALDQTELLER